MLNYLKKHMRFYAICISIIILAILIVLDISKFNINSNQNSNTIKNNMESIGNIQVEDVYARVSKKVSENKKKQKTKDEETTKLSQIDIYSTNKWRIKIPKLKLNAPITEGTSQESLRRTVGHFEETDKWNGNVALAAHNRGYKCNFFQEIKQLKEGDTIIYSTEKGEREYKVIINKVIKETDWSYIKNTKDNRITLITCEMNRREYRRCIQAIEII